MKTYTINLLRTSKFNGKLILTLYNSSKFSTTIYWVFFYFLTTFQVESMAFQAILVIHIVWSNPGINILTELMLSLSQNTGQTNAIREGLGGVRKGGVICSFILFNSSRFLVMGTCRRYEEEWSLCSFSWVQLKHLFC